jgi:hypothetical protein
MYNRFVTLDHSNNLNLYIYIYLYNLLSHRNNKTVDEVRH